MKRGLIVLWMFACGGAPSPPVTPTDPPLETSPEETEPVADTTDIDAPPPKPAPPARPQDRLASTLGLPQRGVYITTRQDGQVLIKTPGAAPAWEALRDLGRKAYAEARREYAPTATRVHLWFDDAGAIASADGSSGTVRVSVGDGWFMSPDRAGYELEVTYGAKALVSTFRGMKLGLEGRATCEGSVKNIGAAPYDLSVRCLIVQWFYAGKPSIRSPLSQRQTYQEHVVSIGNVAPGAEKKFKFQMPPLPKGDKPLTSSLEVDLEVVRDGKVVDFISPGETLVADVWFRVLASLAADGVHTDTEDPSASGKMAELQKFGRDRLDLKVPDEMSDWPIDRQRAFAKKIDTTIRDFYKLLGTSAPRLILRAQVGKQAKIENGKLSEWAQFQM